jgi:Holliday junction DNA helicase RuvA subunit
MVGKIIAKNNKNVIVENNYFGYIVNVANPDSYEIGKVKKILLYKSLMLNNKSRVVEELYGFNTSEEKEFFTNLIQINGIGNKIAIQICNHDIDLLKNFIFEKNIEGMVDIGISRKIATIISEEFKRINYETKKTFPQNADLTSALKSLGYGKNEIEYVLSKSNFKEGADVSDLISDAIKMIASRNEQSN